MSKFKIGDKVRRKDEDYDDHFCVGYEGIVTGVSEGGYISVDNFTANGDDDFPFDADKFELVEAASVEEVYTGVTATGGSSPSQYRMPVNLPLSSDRTQFVDVDLEGIDIIDAWQMNGNLKDIQKAILRIGKKEGTTEEYDLNKILFYTLREKKRRGLISHEDFWEKVKLLGLGS